MIKFTESIAVKFSLEERKRLEARAAEIGMKRTDFIRKAVSEYLNMLERRDKE